MKAAYYARYGTREQMESRVVRKRSAVWLATQECGATAAIAGELMKTVAAYVRCAHPSPDAIKRQLERCEEAARREGLLLDAAMTFQDDGYSGIGPADERPGYQGLAKVLRAGHVKTLVVAEVSRLSRSVRDLLELLQWLDAAGIRVISAVEDSVARGHTRKFR